jgi:hypothetical protein
MADNLPVVAEVQVPQNTGPATGGRCQAARGRWTNYFACRQQGCWQASTAVAVTCCTAISILVCTCGPALRSYAPCCLQDSWLLPGRRAQHWLTPLILTSCMLGSSKIWSTHEPTRWRRWVPDSSCGAWAVVPRRVLGCAAVCLQSMSEPREALAQVQAHRHLAASCCQMVVVVCETSSCSPPEGKLSVAELTC